MMARMAAGAPQAVRDLVAECAAATGLGSDSDDDSTNPIGRRAGPADPTPPTRGRAQRLSAKENIPFFLNLSLWSQQHRFH